MTKRTVAHYAAANDILSKCNHVSYDSLRARVLDDVAAQVLAVVGKARRAHPHSVILEWPDGVLACVVSRAKLTFRNLTCAEKIAAYGSALKGQIIYRAQREPDLCPAQCNYALSLPLLPTIEPLTQDEIRSPAQVANVADLKQALKQLGLTLNGKDECECVLACRRAHSSRPYFSAMAFWCDGTWACLHIECNSTWKAIPPGQFERAYHSSRRGFPFYHLETSTTSDLILHIS